MENIKQEIFGLEKKYWKAMTDSDLEGALALTDFPCVVAGSHGFSSVDPDQFEKMFKSNQGQIKDVTFDENKFQVRQIGPDTAVAAYEIKTADTHAVDTSTWIKKDGKWVCAMHTETQIPNDKSAQH